MKKQSFKNKFSRLIGFPVCGHEEEINPTDFDYCDPVIVLSEIKTVYLAKTSSPEFDDWTSSDEWQDRVSQTANYPEAIRPITVIGDKPLPQSQIKIISKKRKVITDKTHVINCTIDEASDIIHEFAISQSAGRYMKLWYEVLGGYMFGGPRGIIAFVTIDMVLPRGGAEIATYILTATWNEIQTEERVVSPMLNLIACPMVEAPYAIVISDVNATFQWDHTIFRSYEYALTLSPATPDEEDYIATTDNFVSLTGLIPEKDYTLFVRNVCGGGLRSIPATIDFQTAEERYIAIPETLSIEEFGSFGFSFVVHGAVSGTRFWEYSNDGGTSWFAMGTEFPVGYDPRLQATFTVGSTTFGCNNVHRGMNGWLMRLTIDDIVSNECIATVDVRTINLPAFHFRIYDALETISDPEFDALKRFIMDVDGLPNADYDTHPIASNLLMVYPMIGAVATTQNMGLVDASFDLVDNGSVTHDGNGMHWGGTTADYSETGIIPTDDLPGDGDQHVSIYSRVDVANGTVMLSTDVVAMTLGYDSDKVFGYLNAGGLLLGPLYLRKKFFCLTRSESVLELKYDAGSDAISSSPGTNGIDSVRLGSGYADGGNTTELCFCTFGGYLTPVEQLALEDAVTAFVTALGRDV